MTKQQCTYGTWPSPFNSQLLTQGSSRITEPQLEAQYCYWLESRPQEKGRTVVVRCNAEGNYEDITGPQVSVRTRIHEYGGGAYLVHQGTLYYINDVDQKIYCQPPQQDAFALTPEGNYCYGDLCIDESRQQLIAICEIHHEDKEAESCIVAIKLDGSSTSGFNLLAFGNDFYANPRVSPDGSYLSWLTWKHPNMPWDNSACWLAEFSQLGLLQKHRKIAGGADDGSRDESVFQPQWSANNELFFISDKKQWWNIYRYQPGTKEYELMLEKDAEFGMPQWVFAMSTYSFINSYTLFCSYTIDGTWHAGLLDTMTKNFEPVTLPYTSIEYVAANEDSDTAVFLGANSTSFPALIQWHNHQHQVLATSRQQTFEQSHIAQAESLFFTNRHQQQVHGFFYPPTNADYEGTQDSLPPLITICHGGPTGATSSALSLKVQYWTSRGFAVFDINYSGSTGFGRNYRDRLKKHWGKLDVEDICDGVDFLVEHGRVDPEQVAIRGSSAGGFTVLAALTFTDKFKAGASLYGIGDLCLLAEDTHKFESRYMDQLAGPYPKEKALYRQRSPIHHIDQLNCPVIFFQGEDDKVVPPNQAESMVNALAARDIPVAYVCYPGEGHGFRQAETIRHSLETEYAFYAEVFGFTTEAPLAKVPFVEAEVS